MTEVTGVRGYLIKFEISVQKNVKPAGKIQAYNPFTFAQLF